MKTILKRWFGSDNAGPATEPVEVLAQRGVAEAQFNLGVRFASGHGGVHDYAQAEHWYLKAASQNHALAHFNLGMMHAHGQGMPTDSRKSLVWMEKAAHLGDASAQFTLGLVHHRAVGDGSHTSASQSRIEAYKWLHLAAAQGYRGAEAACDVIKLHMTRQDVEDGRLRIAAFNRGETATSAAGET
jgi:TPR repeat protein